MDCKARREFAFQWAAIEFSVVRNMHAAALTRDALPWSAPSNRTLVRETGSLVETNSVPTDRTLYESPRPLQQASPRAMRGDCFHKKGLARSIHDASCAKPPAAHALLSRLRPAQHSGEIRRHATSAASSPELVRDG